MSLAARNVSVSFEGLAALSDVNLSVERGAITGLIGPNGAGKTTLLNVLTGFQAADAGSVALGAAVIGALAPHRIRRLGVARTFQSGRLFGELTVRDNLEAAAVGLGRSRREAAREAGRVLAWLDLIELAETRAAVLPYTDQRRVGIARALVYEPAYLLLDEPAAGMSEAEAAELSRLIRRIAGELGCGLLLIEHNIGLVLEVCGTTYVLDSGKVIEAGDAARISTSEVVRQAYLGTEARPAWASGTA